ncbi:DnaD domain protein [Oscillospiraceae bacterium CM]|nr:DnaD domain protein [Oscillospiraceae bacterium CM]
MDVKLVLSGSEAITLSGQAADKLIRAADGDAALLYLYLLRNGGTVTARQASEILGRSESAAAGAMAVLGRLGLIHFDEAAPAPQKDETPEYTAEDIKNELQNGSVFHALVQEIQKSLGKILTSDDLLRLFGIYDSLGLPPEVILHLVTHCIDENKKRYGLGRVPTMRYIEKAAYTWEKEGVLSLERAEAYLKRLETEQKSIREMKKVLQIKDRELSSGERKYVESWLALGFSPEAVELAYDKTLLKTGRLAWSYMDSIIMSWHSKNLHTVDEIEAKDKKAPFAAKNTQQKAPKTAEADRTDFERMKKFLQKQREA